MRLAAFALLAACHEDLHIADKPPGCATVAAWADADADGFGGGDVVDVCEDAAGYVSNADDCDDGDAAIAPGAVELCDGVDQDCNGVADNGEIGELWYPDVDDDGHGDPNGATVRACVRPPATRSNHDDCDDADADVFPGADELCNEQDDDCDLDIDEDAVDAPTWYRDNDGDGWGVLNPSHVSCDQPARSSDNALDCDDTNAALTDVCPPPPVQPPAGQATCNGQLYTFTQPTGAPELQIASVYEPTATGRVDVWVQRPTTMTLMLSSYEEVDWVLHVDPAVTLQGVLLNGYDMQTVQGVPAGVQTVTRTLAQTGTNFGYWCGYSWPYNGGGCDTNLLLAGVEAFTGQQTTGFVGCYTGESFTLQ